MAPESVFSADRLVKHLPSTVTFVINPADVHSPQTGYPWHVEMDHEMGSLDFYSLIPQKSDNHYVTHYRVERRRPRLLGNFRFTDAWMTTNHRVVTENGIEIHFSQTLFNPERANDKLYFSRPPHNRMEIVVHGRFIEDRELYSLLERVVPREYKIPSLLQCQPSSLRS
jgi:hypothetical protein